MLSDEQIAVLPVGIIWRRECDDVNELLATALLAQQDAERELRQFKELLKTELDQLAGQIEENIHELRVWVEEDLTGRKSIRK